MEVGPKILMASCGRRLQCSYGNPLTRALWQPADVNSKAPMATHWRKLFWQTNYVFRRHRYISLRHRYVSLRHRYVSLRQICLSLTQVCHSQTELCLSQTTRIGSLRPPGALFVNSPLSPLTCIGRCRPYVATHQIRTLCGRPKHRGEAANTPALIDVCIGTRRPPIEMRGQ